MKLIPMFLLCLLVLSQSVFGAGEARPELGQVLDGVENFGEVVAGQIYRGAQPTEEGFQLLQNEKQIKTVLSVRNERFSDYSIADEQKQVEALSVKFISVPLSPIFPPNSDDMKAIQTALTDSSNYPIYIHCKEGKDRTGLSVALYRVQIQGWSAEQAYNEWTGYGFHTVMSMALYNYFDLAVNPNQIFGNPMGIIYDTTR